MLHSGPLILCFNTPVSKVVARAYSGWDPIAAWQPTQTCIATARERVGDIIRISAFISLYTRQPDPSIHPNGPGQLPTGGWHAQRFEIVGQTHHRLRQNGIAGEVRRQRVEWNRWTPGVAYVHIVPERRQ